MYTPRGELNDTLLKALYEKKVMEEVGSCRTREELLKVLDKYARGIEAEEAMDSLAVILSYLEEQDIQLLSDEDLDEVAGGMQNSSVFVKDDIVGLLDRNPGAVKKLRSMLSVLNG